LLAQAGRRHATQFKHIGPPPALLSTRSRFLFRSISLFHVAFFCSRQ
jgi:hypothetical protein